MLDKAKGVITHKIGPLPVWAYVVIGAGLVFVLRMRGGGGSSSDQQFIAANPAANLRSGMDPIVDDDTPSAPSPSVAPAVATPAADFSGLAASIAALAASFAAQPHTDPTLLSSPQLQTKASTGVVPANIVSPMFRLDRELVTREAGGAIGKIPAGATVQYVNGVPISLSKAGIARGGLN